MEENDVTKETNEIEDWHRIVYTHDDSGHYELVASEESEVVNVANGQAWDVIHERVSNVHQQASLGELSPLAFYMELKQMDEALLAQYSSQFKWQVKRHMSPKVFAKLSESKLEKYADIFGVSVAELKSLPKLEASVENK